MGQKTSVVEHITRIDCHCREDDKTKWDCYWTENRKTTTNHNFRLPGTTYSGKSHLKLTTLVDKTEVASGITKNDAFSQFGVGYDLQLRLECDGVTDTIDKI